MVRYSPGNGEVRDASPERRFPPYHAPVHGLSSGSSSTPSSPGRKALSMVSRIGDDHRGGIVCIFFGHRMDRAQEIRVNGARSAAFGKEDSSRRI
jgi:hypothetical protein